MLLLAAYCQKMAPLNSSLSKCVVKFNTADWSCWIPMTLTLPYSVYLLAILTMVLCSPSEASCTTTVPWWQSSWLCWTVKEWVVWSGGLTGEKDWPWRVREEGWARTSGGSRGMPLVERSLLLSHPCRFVCMYKYCHSLCLQMVLAVYGWVELW